MASPGPKVSLSDNLTDNSSPSAYSASIATATKAGGMIKPAPYPCFHRDKLDTGARGNRWFTLEAKVGLANNLVLEQLITGSLGDDFA